jgi:hypothetical protein
VTSGTRNTQDDALEVVFHRAASGCKEQGTSDGGLWKCCISAGVHAVAAQVREDVAFDIDMYRGPINTVDNPTWWAGYGTAQTTAARIARKGLS